MLAMKFDLRTPTVSTGPPFPLIVSGPGSADFPPPPPQSPDPTPVLPSPPALRLLFPELPLPPPTTPSGLPPGEPFLPPPGDIANSPSRLPGGSAGCEVDHPGFTLKTTSPFPDPGKPASSGTETPDSPAPALRTGLEAASASTGRCGWSFTSWRALVEEL